MKAQWKNILVKTTIWLVTEISLNFLGLDNLADYGEFVFGKELFAGGNSVRATIAIVL